MATNRVRWATISLAGSLVVMANVQRSEDEWRHADARRFTSCARQARRRRSPASTRTPRLAASITAVHAALSYSARTLSSSHTVAGRASTSPKRVTQSSCSRTGPRAGSAHRSAVCQLRLAPGACVRGRRYTDRSAVVHQLGLAHRSLPRMPDRGPVSEVRPRLIRGAELSNSTKAAGMIRTAAISGDHIQLDTEPGDYVWYRRTCPTGRESVGRSDCRGRHRPVHPGSHRHQRRRSLSPGQRGQGVRIRASGSRSARLA